MECYIEYLDSKNNFKQTRIEFETYEDAVDWSKNNLENWNADVIKWF